MLSLKELSGLTRRNRFSDYLPYLAYDEETKIYYNQDDTIGYIFEVSPKAFIGEQTVDMLKSILTVLPDDSVIQFMLFADPYVLPVLNFYKKLKVRQYDIINIATERYVNFIMDGAEKGMRQASDIPVRYFRSIISIKMPKKKAKKVDLKSLRHNFYEILSGANLPPQNVSPDDLLSILRRLFNDRILVHKGYDDTKPISKQIILSETDIHTKLNAMQIGKKVYKCTTPSFFPGGSKGMDAFTANQLIGGLWGIASDAEQIIKPFIYSLNIYKNDAQIKKELGLKANIILQQQGFGSLAPTLARKKDEFLWAVDEMDNNTRFLKVIPILWVYAENDDEAYKSVARIKRIWESHGFTMQEDKGILPVLFISALPFGLYTNDDNIRKMDRDFILQDKLAMSMAPVQADFQGSGDPILLFHGRKGQLASLDIFDKHADNYNVLVAASTGSGKSFAVNYIVFNYFAAGDKIRIIDIGGSYKKLAHIFGGRFLEFSQDSDININPFTHIKNINDEIAVLSAIIKQMVLSSTGQISVDIAETSDTIIKNVIRLAWEEKGNDADIDTVFHYLENYSQYVGDVPNKEHFVETASTLAFNLTDFTTQGTYGKWFNGKSNFDISRDDFTVLELEHLKPQKELFKVVTLQIINMVTRDLYLSDRSSKRLIIFDEAWQFLEGSDIFKDVIEEGYRRARKYRGSFSVVVQSLLDLKNFGMVGDVIRANSAWKFMLSSPDFEKAKAEKIIDYDDFVMKVLKTVKSNKPNYSEIFIDSPFGMGVVRLIVDEYSYYIFTSDPKESSKIEHIVKTNDIDYGRAIEKMIEENRIGKEM